MNGNPMDIINTKKKIIEELMSYLDNKDGQDLGDAMKPKGVGVEVTKIENLGDKEHSQPDDEMQEVSKPEMNDDELAELIEAIQSKIGK